MRRFLPYILIAALVTLLYAPAWDFAYLRLDDWGYTAGCDFVTGGLAWHNVSEALSRTRYGGIWMPFTFLSYMGDVTFFGGGWHVHHIVNVALHAIAACLVFAFLCRILALIKGSQLQTPLFSLTQSPLSSQSDPKNKTSRTWRTWREIYSGVLKLPQGEESRACTWGAFIATLVWALHPQRVEAVAWIASRKEELWTIWSLLGLMAWMRSRHVLGTLCCLLACLSKPTAVCFPLLAFLADSVLLRRRKVACYIGIGIISLLTGLVATVSQTHPEGMAQVAVTHVPFLERLGLCGANIAFSLVQTLVPWGVHYDYMDTASVPVSAGIAAMLCGLAVFALLAIRLKGEKRRLFIFAAGFFAVSFLPVSGLFGAFGDASRADRFLYMPAVAFSILLAAWVARMDLRGRILLAAVAGLYACAAYPVISSYRNDFTAFSRTLCFEPDHWRALQHVGSEYCARLGRMDEGLEMMRRSYALSPHDSTAEVLAYALACRGENADMDEVRALTVKIAANPALDRRGMMAEALGIAAMADGDWGLAERAFAASLAAPERFYSKTEATFRLAETFAHLGKKDAALRILRPFALAEDRAIRLRAIDSLSRLK